MSTYTIEVPDGRSERERERGIRVVCDEHGEHQEFQPGYRSVAFYCDGCGFEVEIGLHDDDWRDWGERC
ncbi:hypothetical protein [Halopiger djelfimassiliensis]|uniref:hypothetical protein n=1 Tax=Halopiger djelfimassiliensis TaxID=1293047 RepID=UPI0006782D39|nr:hypothetical protein [Halopiger djelfimassiliensis]